MIFFAGRPVTSSPSSWPLSNLSFLVGVRLLPGQSVALGVVILSIIAATLAVLAGVVLTALADLSDQIGALLVAGIPWQLEVS